MNLWRCSDHWICAGNSRQSEVLGGCEKHKLNKACWNYWKISHPRCTHYYTTTKCNSILFLSWMTVKISESCRLFKKIHVCRWFQLLTNSLEQCVRYRNFHGSSPWSCCPFPPPFTELLNKLSFNCGACERQALCTVGKKKKKFPASGKLIVCILSLSCLNGF